MAGGLTPEEANKRAIEDYSQSSQFARTAAQFTFGANGGAVVAILAFMTTTLNSVNDSGLFPRKAILHNFAIGCLFYVGGVLVSVASMYLFALSKKRWGDAWEDAALTGKFDFGDKFAVNAQKFEDWAWLTLIASALILGVGTYFAARGFL